MMQTLCLMTVCRCKSLPLRIKGIVSGFCSLLQWVFVQRFSGFGWMSEKKLLLLVERRTFLILNFYNIGGCLTNFPKLKFIIIYPLLNILILKNFQFKFPIFHSPISFSSSPYFRIYLQPFTSTSKSPFFKLFFQVP